MTERIVNDPSQHGWVDAGNGKWEWAAGGSGGGGVDVDLSTYVTTDPEIHSGSYFFNGAYQNLWWGQGAHPYEVIVGQAMDGGLGYGYSPFRVSYKDQSIFEISLGRVWCEGADVVGKANGSGKTGSITGFEKIEVENKIGLTGFHEDGNPWNIDAIADGEWSECGLPDANSAMGRVMGNTGFTNPFNKALGTVIDGWGNISTSQKIRAADYLDADGNSIIGGGGGGAVDSVNGKTGVVVLTASDVGALPDDTVIPPPTDLSGYATETWVSTNYAAKSHTHDYAASNHTHSNYAASNHTHTEYAASNHNHSGVYAPASHTHSYVPLSGNSTISGTLTATDFVASSDENKKQNISTAPVGMLGELRGVEFEWKDSGEMSSGVIAQEVEKVFPHLVHTDDEGMKSVAYNGLLAYVIEELKDCRERLAVLEAKE